MKNKLTYSKIISITTISLIGLNILLAVILPIILKIWGSITTDFIVKTLIIQKNYLLPITYAFFIITLIDTLIRFFKKK